MCLMQDTVGVKTKISEIFYYETLSCGAGAEAGAGGAATFCWSRSQSFSGPAPEPGM
jgi:N-methylhydantoinase B/oxoprolinase/acetone carboxylase alpha subunit